MVQRDYNKITIPAVLTFTLFIAFSCGHGGDYPFKQHPVFIEYSLGTKRIPEGVKIRRYEKKNRIVSGIVSHHVLLDPVIDEWYATLRKKRKIKTFIIISPEHYEQGKGFISMSSLDWKHANKIIRTDKRRVKKILKFMELREDRYAMHNEHGIAVQLHYIDRHFPGAKVVPIVMDPYNWRAGMCKKLSIIISDILSEDDDTFLLLSADFSHGHNASETAENDVKTREVLDSSNEGRINRAYSDNNPGLFVMMLADKKLKARKFFIFCHTDSSKFGEEDGNNITSYFFTFQHE